MIQDPFPPHTVLVSTLHSPEIQLAQLLQTKTKRATRNESTRVPVAICWRYSVGDALLALYSPLVYPGVPLQNTDLTDGPPKGSLCSLQGSLSSLQGSHWGS